MTSGRNWTSRGGRHPRQGALLIAVLGTLGAVGGAHAEPNTESPPGAAAGPRVVEAQTRFRRSVELYAEGELPSALAELTRAYQLAPNYRLLFNMGRISHQLRDYAAAVDYFTRYLDEGADEVPAPRRGEVESDLGDLKLRVGNLRIQVADPNFDVVIDDVERGTTPLPGPILLNVGRHRVELISPSGERQVRMVELAGGQTVPVQFKVRPLAPRLRLAPKASSATRGASPNAVVFSDKPAIRSAAADDGQPSPRRWSPWVAWTLTVLCGGAAAVSGSMALSSAADLENIIDAYPVSQRELDAYAARRREFALATDGFLLGTAVLSAISLYLTFSGETNTARTGAKQVASANAF